MEMNDYVPRYPRDPRRELQGCLALYRDLLEHLCEYDDMEVTGSLCERDGIAWALNKLNGQVEPEILQEIEQLDARLKDNADYLVKALDVYGAVGRDQPKSHWWWYLDELVSTEGAPGETFAVAPARAPALALREEEAEYVTPDEGQGSQAQTLPKESDRS